MKKISLIPFAVVTALLASCGSSVKAPKFADKGNKVTTTQFAAAMLAAEATNPYLMQVTSIATVPNFNGKSYEMKESSKNVMTLNRNGKKIGESSSEQIDKQSGKYDSKNLAFSYNVSESHKTSENMPGSKQSSSKSVDEDHVMQFGSWYDGQYLLDFNKEDKTASVVGSKVDPTLQLTQQVICNLAVKSLGAALLAENDSTFTTIVSYLAATEAGTYAPVAGAPTFTDCGVYQNSNVFTVEGTITSSPAGVITDYTYTSTTKATYQIDLTQGKESVKYSIVSDSEVSVLKDTSLQGYALFSGDKVTMKSEHYFDGSIVDKDSTVKLVEQGDYKLPALPTA